MKKIDKYNRAKLPWGDLPAPVRREIAKAELTDWWNDLSSLGRWQKRDAAEPFCPMVAYRARPMEVVIEVYGGVAECTRKPRGIEVVIIDHDNERYR